MRGSQVNEFRALLLHIAERLSRQDSEKISFLECLPIPRYDLPLYYGEIAAPRLLSQLVECGRVSASRPDHLAEILENIGRYDLAKKVKNFMKQWETTPPRCYMYLYFRGVGRSSLRLLTWYRKQNGESRCPPPILKVQPLSDIRSDWITACATLSTSQYYYFSL
jgi:hypothetical protein